MKKTLLIFLGFICLFVVTGCQESPLGDVKERKEISAAADASLQLTAPDSNAAWQELLAYYKNAEEKEDGSVQFSKEGGFYTEDISLTLSAKGANDIFYTEDGSIPGPSSIRYTRPIQLAVTDAQLPRCTVIRAVAYYTDGTKSPVFTQSYFLNAKIKKRFSTPVFSIVAPPDELTSGPDALLVGKRALDTGEYANRTVQLQLFLSDGTKALDQAAVLRVYGDASRSTPVKSLLLTVGTRMETEEQFFAYSFFGTSNEQGKSIRYKDLVLSNGETDFQKAFIRDEYAQALAKSALFRDYEDVQPAVVYINGEYYGLHWMHEKYSNAFFHALYGTSAGRYAVVSWDEKTGAEALEQADSAAASQFQQGYEQILASDLQTEEDRAFLERFMDAENYLDFCALNILIDNANWPSQMMAYAYIPAEENAEPSLWRFLPHDMSNSFGVKNGKSDAENETLGEALSPGSDRYAPLFAKLMEVEEYRTYFVDKLSELLNANWSREEIRSPLKELHNERNAEMQYYFVRIEALRKTRNSGISMKKSDFNTAYTALSDYAKLRPASMKRQLEEYLPSPE